MLPIFPKVLIVDPRGNMKPEQVSTILDKYFTTYRSVNGFTGKVTFESYDADVSPTFEIKIRDAMSYVSVMAMDLKQQLWIDPVSLKFVKDKPEAAPLYPFLKAISDTADTRYGNRLMLGEYLALAEGYLKQHTDISASDIPRVADNIIEEILDESDTGMFNPYQRPDDKLREIVSVWHSRREEVSAT